MPDRPSDARDNGQKRDYPMRFELLRRRDAEHVADGVLWTDGSVSLRWRGAHSSVAFFGDYGDAMRVHHIGEAGSDQWTTARWLDGVCWTCGAPAGGALYGGNGGQCSACSSSWDGPPSSRVEPDKGAWRKMELPRA